MRKGFLMKLALSGIRKNRKVYYPYMLTAILTTAMMYIMASLKASVLTYSATLSFSLDLGFFVTSLFSVIFLFYTNSFLMKRRKKEFGLYNILGMEKKHLARVILWENSFILLASLLLGILAGVLLDKLAHLLLSRLIGKAVSSILFEVHFGAMRYAALLVSGVFVLILLNSIRQVYSARPVELLRSGEVGEREPKAKWVIAVLGLVALGAGYWFSATVKDAGIMIVLFFLAVILVIVGTYMLFTAGSITALKLLRKNRRYYYKPDHFISVSGMIYRMKQNAVGLANVCILSTMVLVMVFSTVSLWFGMKDMLDNNVRDDIEFTSRDTDIAALYGAVDEVLAQSGLERSGSLAYRYASFSVLRAGDEYNTVFDDYELLNMTPYVMYLIPLEDYNGAFGDDETLEPGEVLLGNNRDEYESDTLNLLGETFRIKRQLGNRLQRGVAMASIYDSIYLVVDGVDTLERLVQKQNEAYADVPSRLYASVSFALSGTEEQKTAVAAELEAHMRERFEMSYFRDRITSKADLMELYGGLLFVGLFLGALFIMAMILIIYYKQISEGYDDHERYRIMRKVGLSRREIKRSISSQILIVFFLPLAAAGLHVAFAFPGIVTMFRGLSMTNVPLMAISALISFAAFAVIYGAVYLLTARVYYKIVSE